MADPHFLPSAELPRDTVEGWLQHDAAGGKSQRIFTLFTTAQLLLDKSYPKDIFFFKLMIKENYNLINR